METRWCEEDIAYDGSQLRAHWLLDRFGVVGDAMVAWQGACSVVDAEMADLEDLGGPGIAADRMVHFVWESFDSPDLLLATHRQRLLSAQAREVLVTLAPRATVRRSGDDLYVDEGKLSISIATVTPVSSLIHFACNVHSGGAPVKVASLDDLGVDAAAFAQALLARASDEQRSIRSARAKVRAKGEWR